MYVLEWRTVSALTRGLFWCLFPELRSNEGNKHENKTRASAETVRREVTYIILFLTRHNESINDYENDVLYTLSPCLTRSVFVLLMTSQSIVDDVTMTRQSWRRHLNRDCKCWWPFTASEIGHSPHLVSVTWKYKKLILCTILWRLVYAYFTIRLFSVV